MANLDNTLLSDSKCTGALLVIKRSQLLREEKLKSMAVSEALPILNKSDLGRFQRMYDCGSVLYFTGENEGNSRLYRANFCRDRMCPACLSEDVLSSQRCFPRH